MRRGDSKYFTVKQPELPGIDVTTAVVAGTYRGTGVPSGSIGLFKVKVIVGMCASGAKKKLNMDLTPSTPGFDRVKAKIAVV